MYDITTPERPRAAVKVSSSTTDTGTARALSRTLAEHQAEATAERAKTPLNHLETTQ
jgi:hypothetical protein